MDEGVYDDVFPQPSDDSASEVKTTVASRPGVEDSTSESSSDEQHKHSPTAEAAQKNNPIKPRPKTRKNVVSENNFDNIDKLPPTYQETQPQGQDVPAGRGPYIHQNTQATTEQSTARKPLCPGIAFSILWFFAIIALGIPVAMVVATFYVLLIPFGACIPTFMVALDGMLFVIKMPFVLSRNMINMAKCDAESWDIKNFDTV